jgi:hypothetical protein
MIEVEYEILHKVPHKVKHLWEQPPHFKSLGVEKRVVRNENDLHNLNADPDIRYEILRVLNISTKESR